MKNKGANFKDHFSKHAKEYASYRPTYPKSLYDYIYKHVNSFDSAWDCGTGNGQVANVLAEKFNDVKATDASKEQINHAITHKNISYHVCKAEKTPFKGSSFDLITVGQALHWFSFNEFWQEVRRVSKPNSILACWTYTLLETHNTIQPFFNTFFKKINTYWPPERNHVQERYKTIPFPNDFKVIDTPIFQIKKEYTIQTIIQYLETWSSVKKYISLHQHTPTEELYSQLQSHWKNKKMEVIHPMTVKLFVVNT